MRYWHTNDQRQFHMWKNMTAQPWCMFRFGNTNSVRLSFGAVEVFARYQANSQSLFLNSTCSKAYSNIFLHFIVFICLFILLFFYLYLMEELSSWICFLSISASSCIVCLSRCSLVVYSTAERNIQWITRVCTWTSWTQTTQNHVTSHRKSPNRNEKKRKLLVKNF